MKRYVVMQDALNNWGTYGCFVEAADPRAAAREGSRRCSVSELLMGVMLLVFSREGPPTRHRFHAQYDLPEMNDVVLVEATEEPDHLQPPSYD